MTDSETAPPDQDAPPTSDAVVRKRVRVGRRRSPRRILTRILRYTALALALILVVSIIVVVGLYGRLDDFRAIPNAMPEGERPAATEGLNVLVLGLDHRTEEQTTGTEATAEAFVPGAQRADTMMVLHISEGRREVYGTSIPRDSYVNIPGHGKNKVNAAYSLGGSALAVETVEKLTDIRIDHVVIVDWPGFQNVTDAFGGVTISVDQPERLVNGITLQPGVHTLDGANALAYVRERYSLPLGDLDRVERQQNYLVALFSRFLDRSISLNPVALNRVLTALTQNVSLDDSLDRRSILDLALSLRSLQPQDIKFYSVPILGFDTVDSASIVVYDRKNAKRLWQAFRDEDLSTMDTYYADGPWVQQLIDDGTLPR